MAWIYRFAKLSDAFAGASVVVALVTCGLA